MLQYSKFNIYYFNCMYLMYYTKGYCDENFRRNTFNLYLKKSLMNEIKIILYVTLRIVII